MSSMTLHRVRALVIVAGSMVVAGACSDHQPPTSPNTLLLGVGNNALAAPSGASATASPPSRIDVAWTDQTAGESGFEVHSAGAPNAAFSLLTETTANVTTAGFPDVGFSLTFCYKVRAFATIGKKNRTLSAFSNTSCATTPPQPPKPPAAPLGTRAIPIGSTVIEVRWMDESSDEDGFRIERSLSAECTAAWEPAGMTGPNTTSFTDVGRAPEQWLCYRVFAFRNPGSILSAPSPTARMVLLAAPTMLSGSAIDHRSIQLSWTDNSGFEGGYAVHRAATAGGPYVSLGGIRANSVSFIDLDLASSTTYWYRVLAVHAGTSDFSNEVSVTTQPLPPPTPPVPPDWVDATPYSSSEATIRWSESWNATSYRVDDSLDDGTTWHPVEFRGYDPYGTPLVGGVVERRNCYRVVAINDLGEIPSTTMDCVTLIAGPDEAYVGPDGVFHWKDISSFEESYGIWYCGPEECAPLYSVSANVESYADPWYYSGFDYWVVGSKDGGSSDAAFFAKVGGLTISTERKPISLRDYLARSTRRLPVKRP